MALEERGVLDAPQYDVIVGINECGEMILKKYFWSCIWSFREIFILLGNQYRREY